MYAYASKEKTVEQEKNIKKQITIRIDSEAIDYFKSMADETGIKYQQLINLYLTDCARKKTKLITVWKANN